MTTARIAPPAARPPYQEVMPPLSVDERAALEASIREHGVLVPVEMDTDGNIIDGHHRVAIAEDLGIAYPRVVRAGLSEQDKITHAVALNLARRHLSSEARADAVAALRRQGWSTRRIANATRFSQSTVVRDLRTVESENSAADSKITGSDGKRYAARRATPPSIYVATAREQQRAQDALTTLGKTAPAKALDLRRAERLVRDSRAAARRAGPPVTLPASIRIEKSDFRDLDIEPESVDLILTDPPYVAEAFRSGLWNDLAARAAVWLRPGGFLAAYCGGMHVPEALTALTRHLDYWWTVAVLHDRGTGTAYVRQRAVANGWKPVLIFRAPGGDPQPPQTLPDVITGTGRAKAHHPWEQAVDEAEHLLRALTHPSDQVLDPCLGSGTTAVAAIRTGRSITGCDVDADHVATARQRVADVLADQDIT